MRRALPVLLVLALSVAGLPQSKGDNASLQKQRQRTLDVAAKTPFFTKRGAEAVGRVVAGGQERKAAEAVTDPSNHPIAPAPQVDPNAIPSTPGPDLAPPPKSPAPVPVDKPFSWRLLGIACAKHSGAAVFEGGGRSVTARAGARLDPDTRVVAVSREFVRIEFKGKTLDLAPL